MRTPALLLLLTASALAQEAPFVPDSIAMLPGLKEEQRAELQRAVAPLLGRANGLRQRARQIEERLRQNPPKEEAEKLRKELEAQREALPPLFAEAEAKLRAGGLDDAAIARLKGMPRGPLREEMYAHSCVLEAPGLEEKPRALLGRLVPGVDAAQRALLSQQMRMQAELKDADPLLLRRVTQNLERQRYEMERRFWRVAWHALTPEQMRAVRKLCSPRYAALADPQGNLFLLPALTPSQGVRIRALLTEADAEMAAEEAEIRQARGRLDAGQVPQEERAGLQQRIAAANERKRAIYTRGWDLLQEVLDAGQRDALDALPPLLSAGELQANPATFLEGMELRPEQSERLRAMGQRLEGEAQGVRQEMNKTMDPALNEMGPESPQSMMREMMQRTTQSRVLQISRDAAREALLDVLEPAQVLAWVVSPRLEP